MGTSYIYSSSRVKTLEKELLSQTDIEHLLTVPSGEDLVSALKKTYLATYITGSEVADVFKSLEDNLVETKRLLSGISPEPTLLDFLWVRYDVHNLRVFLRAKKKNLSFEEINPYLSKMGKYDPEILHKHLEGGTLEHLELEFKAIYDRASRTIDEKGIAAADMEFDKGYFEFAKSLAERSEDITVKSLIGLQIDLHNIKTRLRTLTVERTSDNSWFIPGGTFDFSDIETKELVLAKLNNYGGEKHWKEAVDIYINEKHSTLIDIKADDYVLMFLKDLNEDVFSLASLLAYFIKCQNTALTVQTIIVGKDSNQSEELIRKQLRTIHV